MKNWYIMQSTNPTSIVIGVKQIISITLIIKDNLRLVAFTSIIILAKVFDKKMAYKYSNHVTYKSPTYLFSDKHEEKNKPKPGINVVGQNKNPISQPRNANLYSYKRQFKNQDYPGSIQEGGQSRKIIQENRPNSRQIPKSSQRFVNDYQINEKLKKEQRNTQNAKQLQKKGYPTSAYYGIAQFSENYTKKLKGTQFNTQNEKQLQQKEYLKSQNFGRTQSNAKHTLNLARRGYPTSAHYGITQFSAKNTIDSQKKYYPKTPELTKAQNYYFNHENSTSQQINSQKTNSNGKNDINKKDAIVTLDYQHKVNQRDNYRQLLLNFYCKTKNLLYQNTTYELKQQDVNQYSIDSLIQQIKSIKSTQKKFKQYYQSAKQEILQKAKIELQQKAKIELQKKDKILEKKQRQWKEALSKLEKQNNQKCQELQKIDQIKKSQFRQSEQYRNTIYSYQSQLQKKDKILEKKQRQWKEALSKLEKQNNQKCQELQKIDQIKKSQFRQSEQYRNTIYSYQSQLQKKDKILEKKQRQWKEALSKLEKQNNQKCQELQKIDQIKKSKFGQLEQYRNTIYRNQSQIKQKNDRISLLEALNKEINTTNQYLQKSFHSIQSKFIKIGNLLKKHGRKSQNSVQQLQKLLNQFQILTKKERQNEENKQIQARQAQLQLHRLNMRLQQAKKQIASKSRLQHRILDLQRQKEQLMQSTQTLLNQIYTLRAQKQKMQQEEAQKSKTLLHERNSIGDLISQIQKKQQQQQYTQRLLKEYAGQNLKWIIKYSVLSQQKKQVDDQQIKLRLNIKDATQQNLQLSAKINSLNQDNRRLFKAITTQLIILKQSLPSFQKSIQQVNQNKKDSEQSQIWNLISELKQRLQPDFTQRPHINKELQNKFKQSESQKEAANTKLESYTKLLSQTQKSLNIQKQRVKKQEQKTRGLQSKLSQAKQQIIKINSKASKLSKQVQNLQARLRMQEDENSQKLEQLQTRNQQLRQKNAQLKSQIFMMKIESSDDCQSKQNGKQNSLGQLLTKINKLQSDNNSKNNLIQILTKQKTVYTLQMDQMTRHIQEIASNVFSRAIDMKDQTAVKLLQSINKQVKLMIEEHRVATLPKITLQNSTNTENIQVLKQQVQQSSSKQFVQYQIQTQCPIQTQVDTQTQNQQELHSSDQENSKLNVQFVQVSSLSQKLKQDMQILTQQNQQLREAIRNLELDNNQLINQKLIIQSQKTEQQESNEQLNKELYAKLTEIEEKLKISQEQNKKTEIYQKQNKLILAKCQNLETKCQNLLAELKITEIQCKYSPSQPNQATIARLWVNSEVIKQEDFEAKKFLFQVFRETCKKNVFKAELVYKYDPLSLVNFHHYFDGKNNLLLLASTTRGTVVGAFTEGPIQAESDGGLGFLFSITNREVFNFNKKNKYRSFTYDPYYLIYGNNELRVKTQDRHKILFSNFAIVNCYFDPMKKNVKDFLGQPLPGELERESRFITYEIYSLKFRSIQ